MDTAVTNSQNIHSLTDFKRHTTELTDQMRASGRPLVLTVNGKTEFVVQDATSYRAMLEASELAATFEGIRRGLEEMERGEGQPAKDVFAAFRARYAITPADNLETDGE